MNAAADAIRHMQKKLVMLKKTDDFSSVFSFRKRFSSNNFVVHYKPNANNYPQIGFVVSKKVAKKAVDRNYMRRVLREFCRNELTANFSVDVIIQVKKRFENTEFLIVNYELGLLLNKIEQKLISP
jgi:ribonuclease P protein component